MIDLIGPIKAFFVDRDIGELVIFGFTCIAALEWLAFAVATICSMLHVVLRPDKTTNRHRIPIVIVLYLAIRAVLILFYLRPFLINVSGMGTYLSHLSRAAVIILACWWYLTVTLPSITVWYSRARYGIGNQRLVGEPDGYKFIIILPVYNETLKLLTRGVRSMANSNLNKSAIELHVAFDSCERSLLYIDFLKEFGLMNPHNDESIHEMINGVKVFVHKFPHGGKRLTQAKTWQFIQRNRMEDIVDKNRTILLLTDSDNELYDNALHNLAVNFETRENILAFAGYMTCMSRGWKALNFWRLVQDAEYVSGEMNRSFEMLLGTINCMPGGFTAVRFAGMEQVAVKYFGDLPTSDITDYHRNCLGEDRFLTHIMHQTFPRNSMGFCPSARCKTDPPTTFLGLIKQRRRWWLGALSNEVYMLTDEAIWKNYKVMVGFKLLQVAFKCTLWTQILLTILAVRENDVSYVGVSFMIVNWITCALTGIKLGRYKVIWMQPLTQLVSLVVSAGTDIYTLISWRWRTWGGVRTFGEKLV